MRNVFKFPSNSKTQASTKQKGLEILAIVISATVVAVFLEYGLPLLPNYQPYDEGHYTLLWEGEITNKTTDIVIDHQIYYLEINGTEIKSLENLKIEYDKYGIGTYVYAIAHGTDIWFLTNDLNAFIP